MSELVNHMAKMTRNVPSIILQHYVLKKNGYIRHIFHIYFDVTENKLISCNDINILNCTLIKPVLKSVPYHEDDTNI